MKMKQGNRVHHSSQKMVNGSSQEIADMMVEKKLLEPGDHNLLIYNDLRAFREIYSQYSRALVPENEIVVIGTQYDAIDDVKNTLRLSGVDVERYLNQGRSLLLILKRLSECRLPRLMEVCHESTLPYKKGR